MAWHRGYLSSPRHTPDPTTYLAPEVGLLTVLPTPTFPPKEGQPQTEHSTRPCLWWPHTPYPRNPRSAQRRITCDNVPFNVTLCNKSVSYCISGLEPPDRVGFIVENRLILAIRKLLEMFALQQASSSATKLCSVVDPYYFVEILAADLFALNKRWLFSKKGLPKSRTCALNRWRRQHSKGREPTAFQCGQQSKL